MIAAQGDAGAFVHPGYDFGLLVLAFIFLIATPFFFAIMAIRHFVRKNSLNFRAPVVGSLHDHLQVIAAIVLSAIAGIGVASAQETPRLLRSSILMHATWCGDHALILFEGGRGRQTQVTWLDIDQKRQVTLSSLWPRNLASVVFQAYSCSPRWQVGFWPISAAVDRRK